LSLLLTNTEYISSVNFLNFYNNVNVFGTLYVTENNTNFIDVKAKLLSLPSTYISFNYLNAYATNSSVDGKTSNLQDQIDDVHLQSNVNSTLIVTNGASITGLITASAAQQLQITGLATTVGVVQGELTIAQGNITTLQAKTAFLNVVGNYTQFSGFGIKIMNGIVYTSIINREGDSQWYGLMTLNNGLTVSNGNTTLLTTAINSTLNVTGNTTLSTTAINSTLNVTGVSTLSTTNITGELRISDGGIEV
jgi:hypothetical protein